MYQEISWNHPSRYYCYSTCNCPLRRRHPSIMYDVNLDQSITFESVWYAFLRSKSWGWYQILHQKWGPRGAGNLEKPAQEAQKMDQNLVSFVHKSKLCQKETKSDEWVFANKWPKVMGWGKGVAKMLPK